MIKKAVQVVKTRIEVYEVEANEELSDTDAISIVKMRMQTGMPLGLVKEEEKVVEFMIGEQHYDAEGTVVKHAAPEPPTKREKR
jgi:hypothetical protein